MDNPLPRLRRTFAYPSDFTTSPEDSPSAAEILDETEQEDLITILSQQNEMHNAQHRKLLFLLPILSTIPYILNIFTQPSPLPSLLALTSLASTGWLLYTLPASETGIGWVDALRRKKDEGGRGGDRGGGSEDEETSDEDIQIIRRNQRRRRGRASSFSYNPAAAARSPLEMWLPYLNLGLCGLLGLIAVLTAGRKGVVVRGGSVVADLLPVVVYVVVLVAKVVMAGVDPEGELGGLKYRYKGA